jgi:hypothetical protein
MPRKSKRKSVDRSKSNSYKIVADNFIQGAEVAREFEYWNAAEVLIVHAAIALSDALAIKMVGLRVRVKIITMQSLFWMNL